MMTVISESVGVISVGLLPVKSEGCTSDKPLVLVYISASAAIFLELQQVLDQ